MSELHAALEEYLSVRRALGVKLRLPGRLLERFVDFAEREGAEVITTDLALRWATQPADVQPAQWANRLGMVRRFAQYRSAADPRTEVPPLDLLPFRTQRPIPYLYSDEEVSRLLEAARQLAHESHSCHEIGSARNSPLTAQRTRCRIRDSPRLSESCGSAV